MGARDHHFETEVAIDPDRAFALLTDFERHTEWHKDLTGVTVVPPGRIHVGQAFEKRRATPVGEMAFTAEITECDIESRMYADVVVDSSLKGTTARWQVDPVAGGAVLRCDLHMVVGGKMRMFAPMVHTATVKDHAETMAHFTEWAEAQSVGDSAGPGEG